MIFYLVFNGGLYLTQLVLYASLFLIDKNGIFDDEKQDRLSLVRAVVRSDLDHAFDATCSLHHADSGDDLLLGCGCGPVSPYHHLHDVAVPHAVAVGISVQVAVGAAAT
jgi:hypothetical protein